MSDYEGICEEARRDALEAMHEHDTGRRIIKITILCERGDSEDGIMDNIVESVPYEVIGIEAGDFEAEEGD